MHIITDLYFFNSLNIDYNMWKLYTFKINNINNNNNNNYYYYYYYYYNNNNINNNNNNNNNININKKFKNPITK